jgi:glutamine amidotransferase
MCRLFGFKSAVVSRAHRSLIAAENALAEQARHHPDGWGIGYYQGGDAFLLKSAGAAAGDDSFRRASERLASNTFVVHVRRATVGAVSPYNVHPFRHGRWLFAHNGTLHGFERLRPHLAARVPAPLLERVMGTTDTELLFFYLLAAIDEAGVAACGTGVRCVDRVGDALTGALTRLYADTLAADVPPPVVNFILTNGSVFVANRSGRDLWMATQKHQCRDFETCPAEKVCMRPVREGDRVNHLLVASERIGDEDRWEPVSEGGMLVLSDDFRLQMRGPPPGWRQAEPLPAAPGLQ